MVAADARPRSGTVSLVGDTTTPSNVVISTTTNAIVGTNGNVLRVGGFKFTTTSGGALVTSGGASILVNGSCEYGDIQSYYWGTSGFGVVQVIAAQIISGKAAIAAANAFIPGGTVIIDSITLTFKGSTAFSGAFARATDLGYLRASGMAFVYPTVTVSIATPGVLTYASHGMLANAPFALSTTGALPTGLAAGTTYYVKTVLDANTFTFSATPGGAAINTTGSQSGVHSMTPTGLKYAIAGSGIINTGGQSTSYLPGNAAGSGGTTTGGGIYE